MKQVVLYNHNKTTYENIVRIFENDNKCAAVQPTGSGKSFLIFKLAQDNSDKTVVVFEPNRQIIGRVTEQMKEYGIDNIQFYTYQKLNSQHKRDEITIDNVDYICLDELHRIKAKQWSQAVDAIRDKFPNAKVLGLTATPERMDGQNIVDYFDAELACNITLGDAIVNKILPCPTYISALYTFDEEVQRVYDKINESRNSDKEKEEMRSELEAARKQLENALGVPKILEKHIPDKNGKYIVFCQNVEHLNTMQSVIEDWFISAGFEIHTYSVHSKNSNRKIEYKEFQTDNSDCIKLCLCVDMFNEGVHLEGITGVILLRPTQSSIVYLQQIGRAISASDESTPIIFDFVNNGNCLGGGSLKTEIELSVNKQKESIENQKSNNEIFDIGDFYIYDYITESLNIFSNIENKCVDDFDLRLNQLEEYKKKWGHCCITKDKAQKWSGLNQWARIQRNLRQRCELSSEKIYILNQYDFCWDNKYSQYQTIIEHIEEYLLQGNTLPVPCGYISSDGFKLYNHLNYLAYQKRKGKLNTEIEKQLFKMGINFISDQDRWMNNYNAAKEYIKTNNQSISKTTIYNGLKIGVWLNSNRSKYFKNKLSENQKRLLEEICCFDLQLNELRESEWNEKYKLTKEYIDLGKKLTRDSIYKDVKIGVWYRRQCDLYNSQKLNKDRVEKLRALGLLNHQKRYYWEDFITILKDYFEHNKYNKKILWNTVYKNVKLGQIVCNYKQNYRQGKLSEDQYQQLLKFGIDLKKRGQLM